MARGMNTVLLVGTLVQRPELRYTPGGLAILEMNLAGNDHVIGEDDRPRELAWYHRVTLFGAQAETMAEQLQEGAHVFVEGRLNYRTWDAQDGQKRTALDVNAQRVDVVTVGVRTGEPTVIDARGQHRLKDALNQVLIVGNLTRDAELRTTPSGASVTRFGVAVNERFKGRGGDDQERTAFVDVTVWRDLAEGCESLRKGDAVFVVGRLVNDSWTDKEGNRRFTTRLEGQRVEFLTRGPGSGGAGTRPERTVATGAQARPSKLDIDEEFPPEEDLPF